MIKYCKATTREQLSEEESVGKGGGGQGGGARGGAAMH